MNKEAISYSFERLSTFLKVNDSSTDLEQIIGDDLLNLEDSQDTNENENLDLSI